MFFSQHNCSHSVVVIPLFQVDHMFMVAKLLKMAMTIDLLLLTFLPTMVFSLSCVEEYGLLTNNTYRFCDPIQVVEKHSNRNAYDPKGNCRCHYIHVNGRGK